jgi:hypothetical protein
MPFAMTVPASPLFCALRGRGQHLLSGKSAVELAQPVGLAACIGRPVDAHEGRHVEVRESAAPAQPLAERFMPYATPSFTPQGISRLSLASPALFDGNVFLQTTGFGEAKAPALVVA